MTIQEIRKRFKEDQKKPHYVVFWIKEGEAYLQIELDWNSNDYNKKKYVSHTSIGMVHIGQKVDEVSDLIINAWRCFKILKNIIITKSTTELQLLKKKKGFDTILGQALEDPDAKVEVSKDGKKFSVLETDGTQYEIELGRDKRGGWGIYCLGPSKCSKGCKYEKPN